MVTPARPCPLLPSPCRCPFPTPPLYNRVVIPGLSLPSLTWSAVPSLVAGLSSHMWNIRRLSLPFDHSTFARVPSSRAWSLPSLCPFYRIPLSRRWSLIPFIRPVVSLSLLSYRVNKTWLSHLILIYSQETLR